MTNKVIAGLILLVVIISGGVYVHSRTATGGQTASAGTTGTIKVGVAATVSRDTADIGEGELRAYEMVVNKVNSEGGIQGQLVDLVVEDTKGTNEGTVDLSFWSGRRESNSVYVLPKHAYYRYTTPRFCCAS